MRGAISSGRCWTSPEEQVYDEKQSLLDLIKLILPPYIQVSILQALQGEDIPEKREEGLSNMLKKSSGSVRIFYPKFNREKLGQTIRWSSSS